jgi:hypothetical protein
VFSAFDHALVIRPSAPKEVRGPVRAALLLQASLLRALRELALPAHRAHPLYLGILTDKDQMVKPPPRALVRSGCYCLADGGSGHG